MNEVLRDPAFCTFCYAAETGNLVQVQSLVSTMDINSLGTNGETAMYKACKAGHADVVSFLASKSADVNIANSKRWFPINIAAENGHLEVLQVLAANGANFFNVNCLGTNGETATYKACKAGHAVVVEFLAKRGADVNKANSQGKQPIDIAAEKRHVEVLQVLIALGAYFDKLLLMFASQKNLGVVVALLNAGADISIKNSDGKTCLDHFSAKEKLQILTMIQLDQSLVKAHNCALWFVIVKEDGTSDAELFAKLISNVRALQLPSLATAKDANNRAALDVASKPMRKEIESAIFFCGHYDIHHGPPVHMSATAVVVFADDYL